MYRLITAIVESQTILESLSLVIIFPYLKIKKKHFKYSRYRTPFVTTNKGQCINIIKNNIILKLLLYPVHIPIFSQLNFSPLDPRRSAFEVVWSLVLLPNASRYKNEEEVDQFHKTYKGAAQKQAGCTTKRNCKGKS